MSELGWHLDLVWGCKAIGEVLGLTEGQAKYMLVKRELPGRKVGGKWVASRQALEAFFGEVEE